jgi:hypothetical protein
MDKLLVSPPTEVRKIEPRVELRQALDRQCNNGWDRARNALTRVRGSLADFGGKDVSARCFAQRIPFDGHDFACSPSVEACADDVAEALESELDGARDLA